MEELQKFREKIDIIDDKLISLFCERMKLSGEIADFKRDNGLRILNPTREREILCQIIEEAGDDFEHYAKILFYTIFDLSRSYQTKIFLPDSPLIKKIENALKTTPKQFPGRAVVACQGVEGAYSQQACDRFFSLPSIMYFRNFEGVFNAVEKGLCKYGILPIENSTAGSVNQVYDMMKHYEFHIVRSLRLRVDHHLLAKPGVEIADVREIFSHNQAVNQCEKYLKTLKDVKVTICENTALAAKMVAESDRRDIAAISSIDCAGLYDLCILEDDIQNSNNNYTRFICISKDLEIYPGAARTSLMLTIPHKPGSLYNTIAKIAAAGLNLTKLESRPIPGHDFEFMFYFDVEGSIYDTQTTKLISVLDNDLDQFTYLGSYNEML